MKQDVAVRIYGLFAQGNSKMEAKLPNAIQTASNQIFGKEDIVGIREKDLSSFISGMKMNATHYPSIQHFCAKLNRGYDEHFGPYIQLIGAACIHNDKQVLLLELTKDTTVDSYVAGSLTYPQGHCHWTQSFENAHVMGTRKWTLYSIINMVKENIVREIQEEICVEDQYYQITLMSAIRDKLLKTPGNGQLYPIYINRPGTTCRHLCMLADIDMTGTIFDEMAEEIRTHEPEKHRVRIMTFEDLLQLDRVDTICPWVSSSFSTLPFMQTSFIEGHLRKIPC